MDDVSQNPGDLPGHTLTSTSNVDSYESTSNQDESMANTGQFNNDGSDIENGNMKTNDSPGNSSGNSSVAGGKMTDNRSASPPVTGEVQVVCGDDSSNVFPSTTTTTLKASNEENTDGNDEDKIYPSEDTCPQETKATSATDAPSRTVRTSKSLSSSMFSGSLNSLESNSEAVEREKTPRNVATHSVLLQREDSRKGSDESESCHDTARALLCSPMSAAFFLVIAIGIVITEVAVERVQDDFEDRLVARLEQEVRESGRVARRQMLFLTESHMLFARTFEGEVIDRDFNDDDYFFTSGMWSGFYTGSKYLLEFIHSHASAGVVWLPRIFHEERQVFESRLEPMTNTNCSIREATSPVDYSPSFDFASLTFGVSSNKSVYYPLAGRVWDKGNSEVDMSHREPLFETMMAGVDFSSLTTSGEFEETFERAKNTGRAQSSVPVRFGSSTYIMISVPVFSCRRDSSPLWSNASCNQTSFRGIVGLFLDGDAVVSSVFDIMKTVSSVDKIAMFTEDITGVEDFGEVNVKKSLTSQDQLVPATWHGEEFGRGRYVKGYADSLWNPVEQLVEKETLLSASRGNDEKRTAFVIDDEDIADEANKRYRLDDISYEHSFLLNIGGRIYNIKHVLLPPSVKSVKDSLDNPSVAARVAGYIGTVAVAVFASLGLFLYQHRRDRMLQAAREHVGKLEAARDAHKRTIGFAQHELRNPLHVILSSGKELRDLVEERIVPVQAGVGSDLHSVLREEIDRVVDHSQIMERLVNDMNDLNKLDEGQLELNPECLALPKFVSSMAHWHRSFAEVALYGETSPVLLDKYMFIDPLRLRQIIANGLTNSGKYCNSGCIHLYCGAVVADSLISAVSQIPSQIKMAWDEKGYIRFRNRCRNFESSATNRWVVFRVADTGRGLGMLTARELFEPFTQGVNRPVRKGNKKGNALQPGDAASEVANGGTNVEMERKVEADNRDGEDLGVCRGQSDASYHGPDEMSRTIRGTGLGLPLAKSLTQVLGGSIDLREEIIPCLNGGKKQVTVFEMIIPFNECSEPEEAAEEQTDDDENDGSFHLFSDHRALRALQHTLQYRVPPTVCVVDDGATNISVAKKCFRPLKNQVVALKDGDEVVPYLQSSGQLSRDAGDFTDTRDNPTSSEPVDILFVDISMNRMGGDSVCHELRNKWGFELPIIAMTGNTSTGEIEHYRQLGFTGVLAKPFDKDKIKRIMDKLISSSMTYRMPRS